MNVQKVIAAFLLLVCLFGAVSMSSPAVANLWLGLSTELPWKNKAQMYAFGAAGIFWGVAVGAIGGVTGGIGAVAVAA